MESSIKVIIPAFNEERSISRVIADIPKDLVSEIVVIDNNSTDRTFEVANNAGATVLRETVKGYGSACLKGIEYLERDPPDILVFLDGDYSDYPEQMIDVVNPILRNEMELVIGSRALGKREKGSMTIPQIFGNWLATKMIKVLYKYTFTDLGPFRAIKWTSLQRMNMEDKNYGWTVEMQVKAAKLKMKSIEVPVNYRRRIGVSKVSGTLKGTIMAGYKIIMTILKYGF